MRTTTSDPSHVPGVVSRVVPGARRSTVALLGIALGVAALSGCSTSSPGPTTGQPTTVVTATATSITVAPAPTETGGAQPPATALPPPVTTVPAPPVFTIPVTPSPPTTSNPSAPGTTFTGEGLTAQQAAAEQQAVDAGHQPWRRDTVSVAKAFVQSRFGWTNVQTTTGAPMVVFVTNQDGSKVSLHLIQPATKGDNGIWEVDSGVWD